MMGNFPIDLIVREWVGVEGDLSLYGPAAESP